MSKPTTQQVMDELARMSQLVHASPRPDPEEISQVLDNTYSRLLEMSQVVEQYVPAGSLGAGLSAAARGPLPSTTSALLRQAAGALDPVRARKALQTILTDRFRSWRFAIGGASLAQLVDDCVAEMGLVEQEPETAASRVRDPASRAATAARFCGDPTADGDTEAEMLRAWYDKKCPGDAERRRRRPNTVDNLMLGLIEEVHRIREERNEALGRKDVHEIAGEAYQVIASIAATSDVLTARPEIRAALDYFGHGYRSFQEPGQQILPFVLPDDVLQSAAQSAALPADQRVTDVLAGALYDEACLDVSGRSSYTDLNPADPYENGMRREALRRGGFVAERLGERGWSIVPSKSGEDPVASYALQMLRVLIELGGIDGSPSNVRDAQTLAARVRGYVRPLLEQIGPNCYRAEAGSASGIHPSILSVDDWAYSWIVEKCHKGQAGSQEWVEGYRRGSMSVACDLRALLRKHWPELDVRAAHEAARSPQS